MKLGQIALRNISRNIRRTILSMSAIAVAAMAFVFLFSMLAGMKADMQYNLQTFYTGEIRIRNSEFEKYQHLNPLHLGVKNSWELADELAAIEGVAAVSPRIDFGTAIYKDGVNYKARGLGVDFSREEAFQGISSFLVEGRLPQMGENEALVSRGLAEEMGLWTGDKFTLLSQTAGRGLNAITFTITGISQYELSELNKSFFQAPLDRIQYFLRMDDMAGEVLLKIEEGFKLDQLIPEVRSVTEKLAGEGMDIKKWTDINTIYSFLDLADAIYSVMAVVFFILGSTVIINTMMMVVYERRREIGTIAAMGMEGPKIVKLFFLEGFYIAVMGSAIGVLVGIGITLLTGITGIDFGQAMEGVDMEISDVLYPILTLKSTLFVFIYSTTVASLVSLLPSRQSAKVNPIEALRSI